MVTPTFGHSQLHWAADADSAEKTRLLLDGFYQLGQRQTPKSSTCSAYRGKAVKKAIQAVGRQDTVPILKGFKRPSVDELASMLLKLFGHVLPGVRSVIALDQ